MQRGIKLVLDIAAGTVIPILILTYLNEQLGTVGAYVAAALVPVTWVLLDLFLITKRFNVITSYIGAAAIANGLLAFWFVDGLRFALKDSFGSFLTVVVFGGSMIVAKPMLYYFTAQALQPGSPRQERLLHDLFQEPNVARAIAGGTLLMVAINALAIVVNVSLNLRIVTAGFGTTLFNQQVAQVNAITRIVLTIPANIGLIVAIVMIRRAVTQHLPEDEDDESDFWELMELRQTDRQSGTRSDGVAAQRFSGRVIIVGAGAAGLSAAYLLQQQNVEFHVLEASSDYGGRMKANDRFTDFPLALGAQWLTADTEVFAKIVNDTSVTVHVPTTGYRADDSYGRWKRGRLHRDNLGSFDYRTFVNGTWLDFYRQYILPSVSDQVVYNAAVNAIDYSGDGVRVRTQDAEYTADVVIVTAPLPLLRSRTITFTPALPDHKLHAIDKAVVWDGIKVFLEFSERFYPTYTDFHVTPKTAGHVNYFDAAYGQQTAKHVLGLFAVGQAAQRYTTLRGDALQGAILDELDTLFDRRATPSYVQHIAQHWSDAPYSRGAYLADHQNWRTVRTLGEPVANKVYFAGDAYTSGDDWGNVPDAAQSARLAVRRIVR